MKSFFSSHIALQTLCTILHTVDSPTPHKSPVSRWKVPHAKNLKVINICKEGEIGVPLTKSPESYFSLLLTGQLDDAD